MSPEEESPYNILIPKRVQILTPRCISLKYQNSEDIESVENE